MRYMKILAAVIFLATMTIGAKADNDQEDFNVRGSGDAPHVDVWTNKGYDASYYYGEDVAVYFKTDQDCYVVVYDIDPSGEVNVLYPSNMSGSTYARADQVYRIPDTNDDFRMQVSGQSGRENIYAVASYDYMNTPDFMKYIGYDYGGDQYYDQDQFITHADGDPDNFADRIDDRIASGAYSVAHTRFVVDTNYRHHQHYRYADYGPYDVGSVWVGSDWPGCEVWIDGCFYGIAPVLVPQVVIGYHWVWMYYGGYPCYQRYFYVPAHRRFDIDFRFDSHFKDYRYRRDQFRGWTFEERRYRNEPGFFERANQEDQKNIRTRSLPSSVIRDYTNRGIISQDAPIAKGIRADNPNPGHDVRGRTDNPSKPNIDQPRLGQPDRARTNNGDKGIKGRSPAVIEQPRNPNNDTPRVIVPDNPRKPDRTAPVDRERKPTQKRLIEKHDSTSRDYNNSSSQGNRGQNDNNNRSSDQPRKIEKPNAPSENSGQSDNSYQPSQKSNQSENTYRPSGKSTESHSSGGGTVERQRKSDGSSGSSNSKSEKEVRSSKGNNGKSSRRR
jgi:hypothetical protein